MTEQEEFEFRARLEQEQAVKSRPVATKTNWADIPGKAYDNFGASGSKALGDFAHMVMHPIDTVSGIVDVGEGALRKVLPSSINGAMDSIDSSIANSNFVKNSTNPLVTSLRGYLTPEHAQKVQQTATDAGEYFKGRAGSVEAIKNTLATDPVGAAIDASTLLMGGAGAARLSANVAGKAGMVGAASKADMLANALKTSSNVVNPATLPLNTAGWAVGKTAGGVKNFVNSLREGAIPSIEGKAAVDLAGEAKVPAVIAELRKAKPGETAGQAAAPAESTGFSAAQEQLKPYQPDNYYKIKTDQEAARLNPIEAIGKDKAALDLAKENRSIASGVNYGKAAPQVVPVDMQFNSLLERPSMQRAVARAQEIAKEEGGAFNPDNPMTVGNLHYVKLAMDDMIKNPERFALGATEQNAISKTRGQFVNWLETKSPDYAFAKQEHINMSEPINKMQVAQGIAEKLTKPLESGERPTVLANAMRDEARLIKSETGSSRYQELSDLFNKPGEMKPFNDAMDQLVRDAKYNDMAKAGAKRAQDVIGSSIEKPMTAPGMLNRASMVANFVIDRLHGKLSDKALKQFALDMQDPQKVADLMQAHIDKSSRNKAIAEALRSVSEPTRKLGQSLTPEIRQENKD